MSKIGQISRPYRGLRGHDAYGDGNFGASRSGGLRPHKGVDYLCREGDDCLAPIDGVVRRVGVAYADSNLGSIHIQGTGEYWPYYVKILYAKPGVIEGVVVKRGQRIGTCQDVARYHEASVDMGGGQMHNHLHLELRVYADSQRYMEVPS
jgi:hypothetical protein